MRTDLHVVTCIVLLPSPLCQRGREGQPPEGAGSAAVLSERVHGVEMLEIHAERVLGLHFPRAPAVALLAGALGGVGQDHVPDLLGYQLLGLQTATNTLR